MLPCEVRCRLRVGDLRKLMSSAIRSRLRSDVACGHFKWRHDLGFSKHGDRVQPCMKENVVCDL